MRLEFFGDICLPFSERDALSGVDKDRRWDCTPRGQIVAQGPRDRDELITAELDLEQIREVRNVWQFYRDRRPETYGGLCKL